MTFDSDPKTELGGRMGNPRLHGRRHRQVMFASLR
jgi:hypothetical protein